MRSESQSHTNMISVHIVADNSSADMAGHHRHSASSIVSTPNMIEVYKYQNLSSLYRVSTTKKPVTALAG